MKYNLKIECSSTNGIDNRNCNYSNCGDGMWTYGEECDDANSTTRDGCSNCKIDLGYTCINEILKPSLCTQCTKFCIDCDLNKLC